MNCASIPEALLESELFGHERGAFTNASYRRVGRFEEANHGTFFPDEIGELAPALQPKLPRAIQERTKERLGSNVPVRVDLRLITATACDLENFLCRSGRPITMTHAALQKLCAYHWPGNVRKPSSAKP